MATVVAGTYERFVFGYQLDGLPGSSGGGGGAPEVVRSFTLDAHLSSCKSVAAQGGFIASGGADDLIRVWHHNPDGALADIGTLSGHEGNVSCMQFHGSDPTREPTRLVSGSVDGNIIIWSVGQWDALKTMKAHRGGVHALSVHRSGLVAMSAGADSHIAMWDMKKGRVAHKTKLKTKPELLAFTPSGNSYASVAGTRLTITSAETGIVSGVFDAPKRVMCMAQAGDDTLACLGLEGGDVFGYDSRAPPTKPAFTITKAHPTRVKCMVFPVDDAERGPVMGGPGGGPVCLVTGSSEGTVRLWDLRAVGASGGAAARARDMGLDDARDEPLAEATGGGRFTCMAVMPTQLPKTVAEAIGAEKDRDPAEMKKKRKEMKLRQAEKARARASATQDARPPQQKQRQQKQKPKQQPKQQKHKQKRVEKTDDDDDGFEVVAGDDDADEPPRVAKTAGSTKKRKVKEASGVGEDGPLVPRKAGFKTGQKSGGGGVGGKSYEEIATAARRKGSGVKKSKPSRGFGKPSRD